MGNVRIEGAGAAVTISGASMETFAAVRIPAEGIFPAAHFDLKAIAALTKAAKGSEIEMCPAGAGTQIKIGTRTFRIESSDDALPSWPQFDAGSPICWDGPRLERALDYTLDAVSRDEGRVALCGIYFGDERVVATDGHRMHISSHMGSFPGHDGTVVPRNSATMLHESVKLMAPAWVSGCRSQKWARFLLEGSMMSATIVARLVDATFPPWRQVVPDHQAHVQVSGDALGECLRTAIKVGRVSAAASEPKVVKIAVNGELRVDMAQFSEVLKLDGPGSTESEFCANAAYMLAAIRGGDTVRLEYDGDLDPIVVRADEDHMGIVMPSRGQ